MNEEIEIQTTMYPPAPSTFPIVWRSNMYDMIPPRFAVWHPDKTNYQVFDIRRMPNHSITLNPIRTERENPFYFAIQNAGDRKSRTVTIYKPRASKHTHSDVAMWFTGAWLCKRSSTRLVATIPIMGVSDLSHFPIRGNVGMFQNRAFVEWYDNYNPQYVREMTHNRKIFTSLHPFDESEAEKEIPEEIPKFVALALVRDAVQRDEVCPISMESITVNNSAVTSCYHVFEKESIQTWLKTKTSCPVCKMNCSLTIV
jgi:hypothetical protein